LLLAVVDKAAMHPLRLYIIVSVTDPRFARFKIEIPGSS